MSIYYYIVIQIENDLIIILLKLYMMELNEHIYSIKIPSLFLFSFLFKFDRTIG